MSEEYKDENVLRSLYHDEEMSLGEIGDRFDVNRNTIRYWMNKHGIPIRTKSEGTRLATSHNYPTFGMSSHGYEYVSNNGDYVYIHRLLATLEYDLDEIKKKHIHHINGIPWDNRSCNIEPLSPEEHRELHEAQKVSNQL